MQPLSTKMSIGQERRRTIAVEYSGTAGILKRSSEAAA
jgi:hypothetical protein